ncbi:MAG: flagellar protein FlgN [Nitrospinota bacterium]|jgi:hypothetical protein|nr:flagellar protein FlgN [Nitrospinota bacterium]
MPQTPPVVTQILQILQQQKVCYAQLLTVAHRQKKAIDAQNDPDLMKALQEKNSLLQNLQDLDADMQPALQNLTGADRELLTQRGKALKDEAAQTLEELISIENTCAEILKGKKADIAEQMKVFHERKKGLKGYGESGGPTSRFSQEG